MTKIASVAVRDQIPLLSERIVDDLYARRSERTGAYSDEGRHKSVRDVGYHLTYLAEALDSDDPNLYTEYLAWVKILFSNLGFAPAVLPDTLGMIRTHLDRALDADVREEVIMLLDRGSAEVRNAPTEAESFIQGDGPLDKLARGFLDALLQTKRHDAGQMIHAAIKEGVSVRDVYLHVFERTQREIGRLWQTNRISVAQEHFCTAATQMVMAQLYPYIFTGTRNGRKMIMTCVGGELHEIGARMVADFFEMEGWDTYFLGANTPSESIVGAVQEMNADLLAISATMTFHVSLVSDLIQQVREARQSRPIRILVGGYPFNLSPDLWRKVDADGSAGNAAMALSTAERLLPA